MVNKIAIPPEHTATIESSDQRFQVVGVRDDVFPPDPVGVIPFPCLVCAGQNYGQSDPWVNLSKGDNHLGGYGVKTPCRAGKEVCVAPSDQVFQCLSQTELE